MHTCKREKGFGGTDRLSGERRLIRQWITSLNEAVDTFSYSLWVKQKHGGGHKCL